LNQTRKVLEGLDRFFLARSRNTILLLCLAFAILIGIVDYRGSTGFLIVYLAPIALGAWYGGKKVGAVVSIYCTIAWFVAGQIATGLEVVNIIGLTSSVARLAVFLVLARVIAQLRETSRQQHELIQFIVHDLRSPISSAITGLMTLQDNSTHLDELEQEMVSLALVSNQRALTLVNSMLDVAKMETGKMALKLEPASLSEIVDDAFQQVALWANGEEITLESDVLVPNAVLDVDLTVRVLVNLLSNALKFSPRGGEVTVSVHTGFGGGLRFTVEDHGPGIPPEYVDDIFEPFGQVKGTKGGTGLGLTFCRLAVQAQGGKIWAESAVGRGTKMNFTLPSLESKIRHEDFISEEEDVSLNHEMPSADIDFSPKSNADTPSPLAESLDPAEGKCSEVS